MNANIKVDLKVDYTKGIILKILNLILFTTISFLYIATPREVGGLHIVFFMMMFCCIATLTFAKFTNQSMLIKRNNLKFYVYRALFAFIGYTAWFAALKAITLNEATIISYMIPIFTLLLAALFCGERVHKLCFIAVVISFCGMYIVISPEFNSTMNVHGSILAIISSVMWASYDIVCKKQTQTEHYIVQTIYTSGFVVIMMFPIVLLDFDGLNMIFETFTVYTYMAVVLMGVMASINNSVLFLAYKFAPINILMPFSYLRLIFVMIPSYLIYDQVIQYNEFIGVLIIASTSAFIFFAQRKSKIKIMTK